MKRPYLVHFTAIENNERIAIRASLGLSQKRQNTALAISPWKDISLLSSCVFQLKILAYDSEQKEILQKTVVSDKFGNFNLKINKPNPGQFISNISLYELSTHNGLELLLGDFIPLRIKDPKKIIISDFDKTLVDTRYATTMDVYNSLTRPIDFFPPVKKSIDLFKGFINKDFQPFIVTASPHFYEAAIGQWLYKNEIYTAEIFLKDYRSIFSFIAGDLSPKDLRTQGFYKLNHLVNILLMTGIPDHLVLMGDGFESDSIIYLTLAAILHKVADPWFIWNALKGQKAFRLTSQQNSKFLTKIYQLQNLLAQRKESLCQVEIFIRCPEERTKLPIPPMDFLNKVKPLLKTYVG